MTLNTNQAQAMVPKISYKSFSFCKILFYFCTKYFSKKQRVEQKLLKMSTQRYTKMCDIQNLIQMTLNQKLLLGALLSEPQTTIFMNQRNRAIQKYDKDPEISSDAEFDASMQFSGDLQKTLLSCEARDKLTKNLLIGLIPKT